MAPPPEPPPAEAAPPPVQSAPPHAPLPPPQQYQPASIAQAYSQPQQTPVEIPNYLVQAIVVTVICSCIFFSLPFGIIAIVYAAQVNGKVAMGDIQGALAASKMAKTFSWVAFGIGAGIVLIYIVLVLFGVTAGMLGNVH